MVENINEEMMMNRSSLAISLLRVSLGIVLLSHGLLKVFVFSIPGTVGYFSSLGLPAAIAYMTIMGELLIGLGLISGFYPCFFAVASLPILMGATWAHAGNGWLFSNPNGGWEFPLLLIILAISIALQGNQAKPFDKQESRHND